MDNYSFLRMEIVMEVQHWIASYGYGAVFLIVFLEMLGLPLPVDTTLAIVGAEWSAGRLFLVPLFFSAFAGNMLGSLVAYGTGRWFGRSILSRFGGRFGLTEERLHQAESRFRRYQTAIILGAKFILGMRVLMPYLAGIHIVPLRTFLLLNALGTAVWVIVFLWVGRYVGDVWNQFDRIPHRWVELVVVTVVSVVLIGWFWWKKLSKNT